MSALVLEKGQQETWRGLRAECVLKERLRTGLGVGERSWEIKDQKCQLDFAPSRPGYLLLCCVGVRALVPGRLELRLDLICLFSAMSLVSRIPGLQEVLKKHLLNE